MTNTATTHPQPVMVIRLGMTLALALQMGCVVPVDDDDVVDDDDSAAEEPDPTPACTVEVWLADMDGNVLDDAPAHTFFSDAEGRLSTWGRIFGPDFEYDIVTLVRYPAAGGSAIGLHTAESPSAVDFVWDDDRVVAWVDQEGDNQREFEYEDGRVVEDRGESGDCCDGRWRSFEYTDGRVTQVLEWSPFGGPDWMSRTLFDYHATGCVSRIEWHDPETPAETFIWDYSYNMEGRLEAIALNMSVPPTQALYVWDGQCDALGSGLPSFPGVPLWADEFSWPVHLCW